MVDLLELPYAGPGTPSFHDGLAVEILADKRLKPARSAFSKARGAKASACAWMRCSTENLSIYLNARTATGELAGALVTLAAGGVLLHQLDARA